MKYERVEIGSLPQELQDDLSEFCKVNRPAKPLLTVVESWSVPDVIDAYLIWHGIISKDQASATYKVIKLFEGVLKGLDR